MRHTHQYVAEAKRNRRLSSSTDAEFGNAYVFSGREIQLGMRLPILVPEFGRDYSAFPSECSRNALSQARSATVSRSL